MKNIFITRSGLSTRLQNRDLVTFPHAYPTFTIPRVIRLLGLLLNTFMTARSLRVIAPAPSPGSQFPPMLPASTPLVTNSDDFLRDRFRISREQTAKILRISIKCYLGSKSSTPAVLPSAKGYPTSNVVIELIRTASTHLLLESTRTFPQL